jgi:TolA-binding protein
LALLSLVLTAGAVAPLQCQSEPEPAHRRYETPAEALYGLAQQFQKQGDDKAWRETLEYLIERYPNSRHAVMAEDDLNREK